MTYIKLLFKCINFSGSNIQFLQLNLNTYKNKRVSISYLVTGYYAYLLNKNKYINERYWCISDLRNIWGLYV